MRTALMLVFVFVCVLSLPAQPMPPVQTRLPGVEWDYGKAKFGWEGVSVVKDPVNNETLHLCGRNGGAEFGSIGSWALAEDGKTWREMKFASPVLDPLQKKCIELRLLVRLAEGTARSIFYDALEPEKEAEAVKSTPLKLAVAMEELAADIAADIAKTKAEGAEAEAVAHAKPLVDKARANIAAAKAGFAGGKLDAALLKNCFDAQWALSEAADCLANSPGPRYAAAAAFHPDAKCIVLFGGSHGDYVTSDTWIYDCTKKTWRQVWPKAVPAPRMGASLKWNEETKALELTGGQTILNKMVYQQGYMAVPADKWTFDPKTAEWTNADDPPKTGVAPGTRVYRTIVDMYNPCWFDAAPRGDPKATAEWLAKLKPNTWTEVPMPERSCAERDWGGAAYSTDHDEIYRWTGGHCADPSDVVSTYHPGINRWSIGYIPSISGKGMSFDGRPDCLNHTYLHMAYDPVSKRLICQSMGGTGVYDPARMDFEFSVDQPFNRHIYLTCTATTAHGVVTWGPGYFGILDVKEKAWKRLPAKSRLPGSQTDGSAFTYDPKRDALWMASLSGYNKPDAHLWKYDMKTGEVQAMTPAGQETIGNRVAARSAGGGDRHLREAVYLPSLDLILYNNFLDKDKQVGYDPEKNRWVTLGIQHTGNVGSVSIGLVRDTKRDLVWAMSSYRRIYVLRIDPKTVVIGEEPAAVPK